MPATLWAFVALTLGHSLVLNAIEVPERPWWLAVFAFGIALSYLLLRGFRVVWWLSVIGLALEIVTVPFSVPPWWQILLDVVYLALLLAPQTRRYVGISWPGRRSAAAKEPQESWDSFRGSDADRPRGWYVDPGAPRKMRYWAGEPTGWTGSARTPLKIRKAWRQKSDSGAEAEAG